MGTDTATTDGTDTATTDARQRPSLTLSEAATATATSRSTVRRRLDAGELPSAWREDGPDGPATGPWRIPVNDLLAAGFRLNRPADAGQGEDGQQPAADSSDGARDELAELRRQLAEARAEAERWRAVADERQAALGRADLALRAVTAALPAGEPANGHEPDGEHAPAPGMPTNGSQPLQGLFARLSRLAAPR